MLRRHNTIQYGFSIVRLQTNCMMSQSCYKLFLYNGMGKETGVMILIRKPKKFEVSRVLIKIV